MLKYRITKYNPQLRNEQGHYMEDEWISCYDIGTVYNGKKFTKEEYLLTEQKYIRTILFILNRERVKKMEVRSYERGGSPRDLKKSLTKKGLTFTATDKLLVSQLKKRLYPRVKRSVQIPFRKLPEIIRLLLRECFWCILHDSETGCIVEFGYDYYTYITCYPIEQKIIDAFEKNGIYIEAPLQDNSVTVRGQFSLYTKKRRQNDMA